MKILVFYMRYLGKNLPKTTSGFEKENHCHLLNFRDFLVLSSQGWLKIIDYHYFKTWIEWLQSPMTYKTLKVV